MVHVVYCVNPTPTVGQIEYAPITRAVNSVYTGNKNCPLGQGAWLIETSDPVKTIIDRLSDPALYHVGYLDTIRLIVSSVIDDAIDFHNPDPKAEAWANQRIASM